jgi:hypothetical protein
VTRCSKTKDVDDKYSTAPLSWHSLSIADSHVSSRYLTVPRLAEWLTGRLLRARHRGVDHSGGPACLAPHRFLQFRQLVLGRATAEAVDVESVLPDP